MNSPLNKTHEYVLLGKFSTDDLGIMFCKLREGEGSTYFITVQHILQKVRIQKAKLSLKLGIDIDDLNVGGGYSCDKCGYLMDEEVSMVFNSIVCAMR